jgi:uncharacterized protein
MKKIIFTAALLFTNISIAFCQDVPYKVVFDITSSQPGIQQRMIGLIHEIIDARPDATVEVVFYGNSIPIVDKSQSQVMNDLMSLSQNKQVKFRACAIAMKKHHVTDDELVSGVQSVPDGVYEIVKKQAEGYGYIKLVD